jgi:hypothetical protein
MTKRQMVKIPPQVDLRWERPLWVKVTGGARKSRALRKGKLMAIYGLEWAYFF